MYFTGLEGNKKASSDDLPSKEAFLDELAAMAQAAGLNNQSGINTYSTAETMTGAQFNEYKRANQFVSQVMKRGMASKGRPTTEMEAQIAGRVKALVLRNKDSYISSGERYAAAKELADLLVDLKTKKDAAKQISQTVTEVKAVADGIGRGIRSAQNFVSQQIEAREKAKAEKARQEVQKARADLEKQKAQKQETPSFIQTIFGKPVSGSNVAPPKDFGDPFRTPIASGGGIVQAPPFVPPPPPQPPPVINPGSHNPIPVQPLTPYNIAGFEEAKSYWPVALLVAYLLLRKK